MGSSALAKVVVVALLLSPPAAFAQGEEWVELKAEYEKTFQPLPLKRMFGDPDRELNISRRAPYTAAARGCERL